jgi:hypothetical protein
MSKNSGSGPKKTRYAAKREQGLVPHRYSSEYWGWVEAQRSTDGGRIANAVIAHQEMIKRRFGRDAIYISSRSRPSDIG